MNHSQILSPSSPLGRRTLLRAGLLGAAALAPWWKGTAHAQGSRLFSLGVASGDPTASSVVLWTRLAPAPLQGGGMGDQAVELRWEVALDSRMRKVVRRGVHRTSAAWAHSAHITVEGLDPDRFYYYRFFACGEDSPIGRTRTFPRAL